jgi:tetratricopeptide (TPR) repeat protein
VEVFNTVVKLQAEKNEAPKSSIFFLLGSTHEKAKEFKKAVLNYKKCLTLDNKHFGSCIHLANLLANVGEGQRAAKYFKHAIKIA